MLGICVALIGAAAYAICVMGQNRELFTVNCKQNFNRFFACEFCYGTTTWVVLVGLCTQTIDLAL